jgi:translation initiation factor IF-3
LIRAREIRVIDENNVQLGIMLPSEALALAREKDLDLIEVAPQAQPPVCRIMDYGKFKYEQKKRDQEQARNKPSELKGMTMTPRIDDHDLELKLKNILRFLSEGDKVKVTVRFRWRELSHPEFAQANLKKIIDAATEAGVGVVERQPLLEGRQMIMVLNPTKEAITKAKEKKSQKPGKPEIKATKSSNEAPKIEGKEQDTNRAQDENA